MAEETKKVEETTETQASETKENDKEKSETTEETKKEESSENIDYKAELEKVQERIKKADFTIHRLKEKEETKDTSEETQEPKKNLAEEIRKVVREENDSLRKDLNRGEFERTLKVVSSNDDKAELIRHHYNETIRSTGNVDEDLANAKALANRNRYTQELSEAKRALLSSQTRETRSGGAGQKNETESTKGELTPQEKKLAQKYGLSEEKALEAKYGT